MDVYTYGGIDLLEKALNAVAVIFKTKDFTENLLYMAVAIGFAVALWKTISAFSFSPMIKQFLIPVYLMFTLFTVGGKTVTIHDEITNEERIVDNVPLLLAATASGMSTISKGLTSLFEKAMHAADDPVYNWTGHIYAGQTFLGSTKPRVIDGTTKENFQRFCKNCVREDLGLGLYTREDLENHPSILEFLAERSSQIRSSSYRVTQADLDVINSMAGQDPPPYDGKKPLVGELRQVTCSKIAKILYQRTEGKIRAAKDFIMNNFEGDREKLLRLNGQGTPAIGNLFQQSLSIDTIKNYTYGQPTIFGAAKAEMQQLEAQKISGIISMKWIVALRNYLEALLYLFFPLILLITFLFLGLKAIQGWIFLLGWISLWPPCYVCANFLLTAQFDHRAKGLGLLGKGYTLFTSDGLFQLNQQMEGLAFGVFASIPILSLAVLMLARGGATALAHWAGGLGGFAQGAAAQAAGEVVSGNYSFDNVSAGNQQFSNQSRDQRNLEAFYACNSMTHKDVLGKTSTDSFGADPIFQQNRSSLQAGVNIQESLSHSIGESQKEAASLLDSSSENFSADLAHTINATEGLNRFASTSHSQVESADGSMSAQLSSMIQNAESISKDYAHTQGISEQGALEEAVGASLGGKFLGTGISGSEHLKRSFGSLDQDQKADRVNQALNVQEAYNDVSSFVLANREALSQEEGGRSYIDWAEQWNQTQRSAASVQQAYSETQSWDRVANENRNSSSSINQDLSTNFDRYLLEKTGDVGKKIEVLNDPKQLQGHLQAYTKEKIETLRNDLGITIDKEAITTPGHAMQSRVAQEVGDHHSFKGEGNNRVPDTKPRGFELQVPIGEEKVFSKPPEGNPLNQEKVQSFEDQRSNPKGQFQQAEKRFEELQDTTVLDNFENKTVAGKVYKTAKEVIKDPSKLDKAFYNLTPGPKDKIKVPWEYRDLSIEKLQEIRPDLFKQQDQPKPPKG